MKNEERPEIFRGHFEECLRHLGTALTSQVPKGSKGATRARQPVADFCCVIPHTVARWLNGAVAPVGDQFIKLMYYLDLQGYSVIELERMQKVRRNFAELIAFGLLTSENAAQLLGYAKTQSLYQVLWSKQGTSEDKERKMWEIWKERKEALELKKEKAGELYRLDLTAKVRPRPEAPVRRAPMQRHTAMVSIMEGLLVLLEEGSFDELSKSELAGLQQAAGGTILRLSAHLSALSFKLIMSDQRKGGG